MVGDNQAGTKVAGVCLSASKEVGSKKGYLKLTVSRGASDQCFFTQAGIPAVIFGPGEKSVCHKENEWVEVDQLDKAVKFYQLIINKFGK